MSEVIVNGPDDVYVEREGAIPLTRRISTCCQRLAETLRENQGLRGAQLRAYADDGTGDRHLAKRTIDVNR